MQRTFFDDELVKTRAKIVLCPSCDNEFKIDLEQIETVCEECGEFFSINPASEEFVWHPSEEY